MMEAPDEPGVGDVRNHADVELREETALPSAERNVRGSLVRICNLKTDTDLNGTVKCAVLWWWFWMWTSPRAFTISHAAGAGLTAAALEMHGTRVKIRIIDGGPVHRGKILALRPDNIAAISGGKQHRDACTANILGRECDYE